MANQQKDSNKKELVMELRRPETVSEFKIVYDKALCIAAGPCFACHPEMWGHDEDFKAILKDGPKHKVRKISGTLAERDLDESELEMGRDSEDICPVDAIRFVRKNGQ